MVSLHFNPANSLVDLDECLVYGSSPNAKCINSAVNERTITCDEGYYAVPPLTNSIILKGDEVFTGCIGKLTIYTILRFQISTNVSLVVLMISTEFLYHVPNPPRLKPSHSTSESVLARTALKSTDFQLTRASV